MGTARLMGDACRIEMLGGLTVRAGDRVITRFRTEKTAALLAILASPAGASHPRESLAEMFWPEEDGGDSRGSLRVALASLRRQLEPSGVPHGSVLESGRKGIRLNPEAVGTDVADFRSALDEAYSRRPGPERAAYLLDALALYCGHLLPGHYTDWVIIERERLEERYFAAVEDALDLLVDQDDLARAIRCARTAVAVDPTREESRVALMELLADAGDPAGAIAQFEDLARVLAQDLDSEPTSEARDLRDEIERRMREHNGTVEPPPRRSRKRKPSRTTPLAGSIVALLAARVPEMPATLSALLEIIPDHAVLREKGPIEIAFSHTTDAMRCALVLLRTASETREKPPAVALDAGEVQWDSGGCSGFPVDRARGLLMAAHPGQLVCSESVAGMARESLPPGCAVRDLGPYRLRGTEGVHRVFSVRYPGMPEVGSHLPTADLPFEPRLPVRLDGFFGRQDEINRIRWLLTGTGSRLVCLTGAGGSGKTRLAVEAAEACTRDFAGAVRFVGLQDLVDPEGIPSAIVQGLGLERAPTANPLDQAADFLAGHRSLLVVDNLEHLLDDGVTPLTTLVESCPELRILVTSRRELGCGEWALQVAPLSVGDADMPVADLLQCPSVELFVERAQRSKPDFRLSASNATTVQAICARLEGVPLAIELAAARVGSMGLERLHGDLQHRLDVLSSRRPSVERHASLETALEWSYKLLPPELQRFFCRLAVFRGGWDAGGAEAVCEEAHAAVYLELLSGWSLIDRYSFEGHELYRMLQMAREFAWAQLDESDREEARLRHARYHTRAVVDLPPSERQQPVHLAWRRAHNDDLDAALVYWRQSAQPPEDGMWLAVHLTTYWMSLGLFAEGIAHFGGFLERPDSAEFGRAYAAALNCRGVLHFQQAQVDEAIADWTQAREAALVHDQPVVLAHASGNLGNAARRRGDAERALPLHRQAHEHFVEAGSDGHASLWGWQTGLTLLALGETGQAEAMVDEALRMAERSGDCQSLTLALGVWSQFAYMREDWQAGREASARVVGVARESGDQSLVAMGLLGMAVSDLQQGDLVNARGLCTEALPMLAQGESLAGAAQAGAAQALELTAWLMALRHASHQAAQLLGAAHDLREKAEEPVEPMYRGLNDRILSDVQAGLTSGSFDASWSVGVALGWRDAIGVAIRWLEPHKAPSGMEDDWT